ncbi:transposase [Streptomyces sp. NPDC096354]|uniref:transposase n=1 Tax=Streptomyces sp. NPDC096354 TaxID=3366088 RepID=UPI0038143796
MWPPPRPPRTTARSCPASIPVCGSVACRAPGRQWLHLSGPPGAGRPGTRGHRHRTTAGQPHSPAPPRRGFQPRRLPHRLRPPTGDLPPGPGQPGPARPLPHLLAHRGAADRGASASPGPCPVHHLPRKRPQRGLPATRTPRPETSSPHRPTDTRVEDRYAVRSGVEGTVNEFVHGHGMRRCRYRGQDRAHVQHILTAIAVNIERLSGLPPTGGTPPPRYPTAFQNFLDLHGIRWHAQRGGPSCGPASGRRSGRSQP